MNSRWNWLQIIIGICTHAGLIFGISQKVMATEKSVRTAMEFRDAVATAQPGDRIILAPGNYSGGFHFNGPRGDTNSPVVIAAAEPANPPVFEGGSSGLQFSKAMFLELHNLVIRNMSGNGINLDDGGEVETPSQHIIIRGLKISDIGPQGNNDAIKLSGIVDFRIEGCTIERWGTGGGSGIDMVGCHRGIIESNYFQHTDTVGSTGVQAKGGTSQIQIRKNRFDNAGGRAINIGGSTGFAFFRPPLKPDEDHWEAKDLLVEGNHFWGGGAAIAYVGVNGSTVRSNVIYHPSRWAVRILQETKDPSFVPSRDGQFTDNTVVFYSRDWAENGVNIGPGTAAETFTFARNWWYCMDQPMRSQPRLPIPEKDGVYGKPPLYRDLSRTYLAEICEILSRCWPTNRTVNIVCHGHSVPAGYFKTPKVDSLNAYPHLLYRGLKERFPNAVINVIVTAIGGEDSESGARRFEADVLALRPDIITLDYGLNDRRLGLERASTAWKTMMNRAQEKGIKIILLTPTPDTSAKLLDVNDPINQHATQIRELAWQYNIGLVDSLTLFLEKANSDKSLSNYMSQVNHPNRLGHELVAAALLQWFP